MTEDVPNEIFERQVQDVLAHLYDFTELQNHPLASQIAPHLTGLQRVQTVRRVLIDLIEQLKVHETTGIPSRQDRVYSLLSMRYVEGLPTEEVLKQLALSERQFYRDQNRAIHTLSQLLWDHLQATPRDEQVISVKSEMQRLSRQSAYAAVDLDSLLSGAIGAVTSLAEHRDVTVDLSPHKALADYTTHPEVFRQTVIWILSQIITQVAAQTHVTLSAATVAHNLVIDFEISGPSIDRTALTELLTNNPTAAEFLTILQGTIAISERMGTNYGVQLQLTRQEQVILVIDDNPDVVALLERYVTGSAYKVISAYDADEGLRLAQTLEPSWIVLDIMLPNTDGWKILQLLKSHPRTQATPVLVCSVLENPDLALSLGADAYLLKPPDRVSFLETLRRLTEPERSLAPPPN